MHAVPLLETLLRALRAGGEAGLAAGALASAVRPLARPPVGDAPYGRRVLLAGRRGELTVAAWRAGASCAVHDHGGARGFVLVVDGVFEEQAFSFDAGELTPHGRRTHAAPALIAVPAHAIHRMRARAAGLTVHAYGPASRPVRVFDPDARITWLSRGGGAWLPPPEVVAAERWVRQPSP